MNLNYIRPVSGLHRPEGSFNFKSIPPTLATNASFIKVNASPTAQSFVSIDRLQPGHRFGNGSKKISLKARLHLHSIKCCEGINGKTEHVDSYYMKLCVNLAKRAQGRTSPNPMVGCLIVKNGQIIGQGFHPKAGEPHGEVFALREAGANAEGATAYVSLEPCNHYGRTPPCTKSLIEAKVRRVVVGMVDPNPIVASKGIEVLRNAGIEVTVGVEEHLCQKLNEAYIHHVKTGKPFVTMRYSMSLDGKMLDDVGESREGAYYSKLLQEYDGVIISDLALKDNPTFLSYEYGAKQPLRVVVTRTLDLPLDLHVFDTSIAPTIVLTDEISIMNDAKKIGKSGGQKLKILLKEKGVEVIALKKLDVNSVIDVCKQHGLCSVLLDTKDAISTSTYFREVIIKQALEEKAVQKIVIALFPVIDGHQQSVFSFDISSSALSEWRIEMSKNIAVVEGYL